MQKKLQIETIDQIKNNLKKPKTPLFISQHPFQNIYISSKKNSGKTNLIFNIIKKLCNKKTKIFWISPTYAQDQTFQTWMKTKMQKWNIQTYPSLVDGKRSVLENILLEIRGEHKPTQQRQISIFDDIRKLQNKMYDIPEKKTYEKQKDYQQIDYCLIIDDAESKFLRNNNLLFDILRQNRHYKMMTIISCHQIKQIDPRSIQNINQVILFKNMRKDKLKDFFQTVDIANCEDFQTFHNIYLTATEKPYSFLNIDFDEQKMQRNFDEIFVFD